VHDATLEEMEAAWTQIKQSASREWAATEPVICGDRRGRSAEPWSRRRRYRPTSHATWDDHDDAMAATESFLALGSW